MNASPTFSPPCGPITGWQDGAVLRATGIPYAEAARFKPPAPRPDWTETYPATELSPACPQGPVPFLDEVLGTHYGELPGSEDCQRLSVTMPGDLQDGERLPVMVWLHGGSYTTGSGDLAIFKPNALVSENRVVVVSVTYRLGLFGYLGTSQGRPANLGLLDQLEAFRWVQRNIAAFGGDPGCVTAFGQSAGGDAVAHLMAIPEAPKLFQRAIIQSAPLGITRGRAKMNAAMAVAAEAVTEDTPMLEVVEREAQVTHTARRYGLLAAMPFGIQYGHAPLPPEEDIDAAWDATAPGIQVLIGHTSEESRLFLPRNKVLGHVAKVPVLGPLAVKAADRIITEAVYGRASRAFAKRHAKAGGRANRYMLSWSAPGNIYGAAHTVDLPLLLGDEDTWRGAGLLEGATWAEINATGYLMRNVWASFARNGTLGGPAGVPGTLKLRAP